MQDQQLLLQGSTAPQSPGVSKRWRVRGVRRTGVKGMRQRDTLQSRDESRRTGAIDGLAIVRGPSMRRWQRKRDSSIVRVREATERAETRPTAGAPAR